MKAQNFWVYCLDVKREAAKKAPTTKKK